MVIHVSTHHQIRETILLSRLIIDLLDDERLNAFLGNFSSKLPLESSGIDVFIRSTSNDLSLHIATVTTVSGALTS